MTKNLTRIGIMAFILSASLFVLSCGNDNENDGAAPSGSPTTGTASPKPSAPTLPADNNYGGAIDRIDCEYISGWLWASSRPDLAIPIEIYVDNKLQTTLKADQFRKDIRDLGFGTGKYAFFYPLPENLKDGKPHSVSAKVEGANYSVKIWEKIQPTFTCKPK